MADKPARFNCWYCGRFAKLIWWAPRYAETGYDIAWECRKCGSCSDGT